MFGTWGFRIFWGYSGVPIGSLVVPFWGLPYRLLDICHKKELLRSLWIVRAQGFRLLRGLSRVRVLSLPGSFFM